MKGRKPALAVIEGGASTGRVPGPPAWLPLDGKREWKRVATVLHGRGLLTTDALGTLESYCLAVAQIREFERAMAGGRIVIAEDGSSKPHVAFKMQQAAMREARLLAAELALTPQRQGTGGKGDEEPKGDGWEPDLLA